MKFIFFALLLMGAGVLSATAQSVKLFAEAGLNQSFLGPDRSSVTSQVVSSTNYAIRPGFHLGGYAEFTYGNFSVDPGLQFSRIGTEVHGTISNLNPVYTTIYTLKDNISYLELPVNILYHFKLKNHQAWFVGLGPYLGYGLSGYSRETSTGIFLNGNGTSTVLPGTYNVGDSFSTSGNSSNRLFTYGANVLVGVNLPNNFRLSAGYDLNISGLYYTSPSPNLYNHTLKLSLGYAFI